MQELIETLIKAEKLPSSFASTVEKWYLPVIEDIAALPSERSQLIGVQGSQGSGKSTFAQFIKLILEQQHGYRVAVLSLDDFYLTHDERLQLAKNIHPLLATRGVPGTHDIALALQTIKQLSENSGDTEVLIPRFNKANDDRYPETEWEAFKGRADYIVFEGWCVGIDAQDGPELKGAINALENDEDPNGTWRIFSNEALKMEYKALFDLLDMLVVIQAPSFECVYQWRTLQEEKLKLASKQSTTQSKIMSPEQIKRFIAHYERLTRHCLNTLPDRADCVLSLDSEHNFTSLKKRSQ